MNAFVGSVAPVRKSGFVGGCKVARSSVRSVARVTMQQKSRSMPFMDVPAALDGSMAGDVGFDPLNISGYLNLKFLREAELKHGRIAMLACMGWIVQELYTFPMYQGAPTLPTAAHDYFAKTALAQVALFASLWEILTTPAVIQMVRGQTDREPGYFGFDPLNFTKGFDPKKTQQFKLIEILNGRLAMIAIGGLIHQAWITKMGAIEQIQTGYFFP